MSPSAAAPCLTLPWLLRLFSCPHLPVACWGTELTPERSRVQGLRTDNGGAYPSCGVGGSTSLGGAGQCGREVGESEEGGRK